MGKLELKTLDECYELALKGAKGIESCFELCDFYAKKNFPLHHLAHQESLKCATHAAGDAKFTVFLQVRLVMTVAVLLGHDPYHPEIRSHCLYYFSDLRKNLNGTIQSIPLVGPVMAETLMANQCRRLAKEANNFFSSQEIRGKKAA